MMGLPVIRSVTEQLDIWSHLKGSKYIVGCNLFFNAIANQLIQFLRELNTYKTIDCVAIVHELDFKENYDWYMKECCDITLVIYKDTECERLSLLDIIILGESNYDLFAQFPSSVVKVGCQHGIDVDIKKTIDVYGGGFCFDYILGMRCHIGAPNHSYINKFPECMRFHMHPFVCEIPFGLPKLDAFFNSVTNCKKQDAIIYHLSYLAIEKSGVVDSVFPTLKKLLNNFPDYTIVFRPYHLDRGHEVILKCIEFGSEFDNFLYSDSDNYISDYSRGALMLTHREYSIHLFELATGRPTVLHLPESECSDINDKERHYTCHDNNLIPIINELLLNKKLQSVEKRKEICQSAGVYNAGNSVEYFVENIEYIVTGKPHPSWKYYDITFSDKIDLRVFIGLHVLSCRSANIFFIALLSCDMSYKQALLFAADSYSRVTQLKFYYYRHALKFFYQFVINECLSLELSDKAIDWWLSKGRGVLEFIENEMIDNHASLNNSELWLKNIYDKNVTIHNSNIKNNLKTLKVVNVTTLNPICSSRNVILFGAGQFAVDFIEWNLKEKQVVITGIVDSDLNKQGSLFLGWKVGAPHVLNNVLADVLICSQAYLPEIYCDLVDKYNFKNEIFTFSGDMFALSFIDVL
ncbi:hypothetical protein ACK33U_00855 [Aeromonas jandaei]|uniref:hypothetical protein n=1 Tax=Aeromonas jandaei TaxID=650 RepID=UPI003988AD58